MCIRARDDEVGRTRGACWRSNRCTPRRRAGNYISVAFVLFILFVLVLVIIVVVVIVIVLVIVLVFLLIFLVVVVIIVVLIVAIIFFIVLFVIVVIIFVFALFVVGCEKASVFAFSQLAWAANVRPVVGIRVAAIFCDVAYDFVRNVSALLFWFANTAFCDTLFVCRTGVSFARLCGNCRGGHHHSCCD